MTDFLQPHTLIILLAPIFLGGSEPSPAASQVAIEVSAGESGYPEGPVVFQLPREFRGSEGLVLSEESERRSIPVQRIPGKPQAAWVMPELKAGETRIYRLALSEDERPAQENVACRDDGKHLNVTADGRPILCYNHAVVHAPEGMDPIYARSGHIHPLLTPSGRPVTDDFPPDHAHQHGIFFAWVNTTFEGRPVDFWNQLKKEGSIEHAGTVETVSGPVFAQFQVQLHHKDLTAPGGPKIVLEETWTVRV